MPDISGKRVAILATDYFEEAELFEPMEALREVGAEVDVIAPKSGEIKALKHVEPGKSARVDKTLDEADPDDYDALILPGGAINSDHLRMEQEAREFTHDIYGEGKPLAVICHAPWMLVSTGIVEGKRVTSYYTLQDDIRNAGGQWMDEEVVEDGNLITSRTPDDLAAFNEALIAQLAAPVPIHS